MLSYFTSAWLYLCCLHCYLFQTLLLFLKVRAHLTQITFAFFRVFLKETVPQFNQCFTNKWCCQRLLLLLDSARDAIICFRLPERIRGTLSRRESLFKGLFDMSEPTCRHRVPSFTESAVDSIEDRATADWQCALSWRRQDRRNQSR